MKYAQTFLNKGVLPKERLCQNSWNSIATGGNEIPPTHVSVSFLVSHPRGKESMGNRSQGFLGIG